VGHIQTPKTNIDIDKPSRIHTYTILKKKLHIQFLWTLKPRVRICFHRESYLFHL